MKTSYNAPTDSEIVVSDFACSSSAPSILMRTWFLGPKKPRRGCTLDSRKYGIFLYNLLETPKAGSSQRKWRTVPSLVSSLTISFPHIPECPGTQESCKMVGGNVIHCLLEPLYQWGHCFSRLKSFPRCLTIRANTNIFFWFSIHLNFVSTG